MECYYYYTISIDAETEIQGGQVTYSRLCSWYVVNLEPNQVHLTKFVLTTLHWTFTHSTELKVLN